MALAHAVIEGGIHLLLWAAFKVVTLGRIRISPDSDRAMRFRHGFARTWDGQLEASEGTANLIGFCVYVVLGVGYWWFFT